MRKVIITAYDLNIGGIEKSLLALLKMIDYKKYKVTLLLEHKKGIILNKLPKKIKIIEYKINNCKFVLFRKIINRLKLLKTIIFNYHKYDFACCYAPYSIPGSILTRYFSKNNCIWVHTDYYYFYNKNISKINSFFKARKINLFKHIIFVSKEANQHFNSIYSELKEKTLVCNNLIDDAYIKKMAKKSIKEQKTKKFLLINICRHEEKAKRLTRLIKAVFLLKKDNYDFEVWLIGEGKDTNFYKKMISRLKLNNFIKLIGFKKNPYPYYKLADALILTSDYEGFPVVYLESIIFNVPIITTIDVSGKNLKISNQYGLIMKKNEVDVYKVIKKFLNEGYKINKTFDAKKYNLTTFNMITNMFDNKWRM